MQFTPFSGEGTVWGPNNSGLDDFLFRRYSSTQSRWISPDPAGLAAVDPTNPQSWNRYAYVMNNPLGFVDPLGLDCQVDDQGNCKVTVSAPADCPIGSEFFDGNCQLWNISSDFPGNLTLSQIAAITKWFNSLWAKAGGGGSPVAKPPQSPANSGFWQSVNNIVDQIGKYVPGVCGGGVFNYAGANVGPPSATVAVAKWQQADTQTGYSEGIFSEISTGEGITGGYGSQGPLGGQQEQYLFFGLGGRLGIVNGNFSEFGSDSGSLGIALEGSTGRAVGGVGTYLNLTSFTSCYGLTGK